MKITIMDFLLVFLGVFVAPPLLFCFLIWVVSLFDKDKKWVDMDRPYNPPWE